MPKVNMWKSNKVAQSIGPARHIHDQRFNDIEHTYVQSPAPVYAEGRDYVPRALPTSTPKK